VAAEGQEGLMGSVLDDPAVVHDEDAVGEARGL
jgi:hypothetical protein